MEKIAQAFAEYTIVADCYIEASKQFNKQQSLKNYISMKKSHRDLIIYKNKYINCFADWTKNYADYIENIDNYRHNEIQTFIPSSKFERVLTIRNKRAKDYIKLVHEISTYEIKNKLNNHLSITLSKYIKTLNEKELNTTIDQDFPKQTYKKLPKFNKYNDIKKIIENETLVF